MVGGFDRGFCPRGFCPIYTPTSNWETVGGGLIWTGGSNRGRGCLFHESETVTVGYICRINVCELRCLNESKLFPYYYDKLDAWIQVAIFTRRPFVPSGSRDQASDVAVCISCRSRRTRGARAVRQQHGADQRVDRMLHRRQPAADVPLVRSDRQPSRQRADNLLLRAGTEDAQLYGDERPLRRHLRRVAARRHPRHQWAMRFIFCFRESN